MTYGYKHLGIFYQKFIEVTTTGFVYKGKHFGWLDVKEIRRYDSPGWSLFALGAAPVTYLFLKNKTKIRITGYALIKEGMSPKRDFFRATNFAYDELVSIIEKEVTTAKKGSSRKRQ